MMLIFKKLMETVVPVLGWIVSVHTYGRVVLDLHYEVFDETTTSTTFQVPYLNTLSFSWTRP